MSIQTELMEYAMLKLGDQIRAGTLAFARPWTYLYHGAETNCVGIRIEIDGETTVTFRVEEMHADLPVYEAIKKKMRPGPPPTPAQRDAWRSKLPNLTR